jgi:hypothetical protein
MTYHGVNMYHEEGTRGVIVTNTTVIVIEMSHRPILATVQFFSLPRSRTVLLVCSPPSVNLEDGI